MAYIIVQIPNDTQKYPGASVAIEHLRGREIGQHLGCQYVAEFGEHLRERGVMHRTYASYLSHSYHLLKTFYDDDDIYASIARIFCFHNDPTGLRPPHGYVERVEPDRLLMLSAPPVELGKQFTTNATHATFMGQLNISQAHTTTKGSGRSIAIVDSGIDPNDTHNSNAVSLAARNVQYASYHDMLTAVPAGTTTVEQDDLGHGTAMAKIMKDVAPEADLHIIRVLGKVDTRAWDVMAGVAAAVFDCEADIINLSLGFPHLTMGCSNCGLTGQSRSKVFESLLEGLQNVKTKAKSLTLRSPIFVAATGNYNRPAVDFPAGYDITVAVGALTSKLERASFSNYGKAYDRFLMLPGGDPTPDMLGKPTEYVGEGIDANGTSVPCLGTSAATAYASGLLALYWSDPRYQARTPNEFIDDMLALCDIKLKPFYDINKHGKGRLYFK
jgi:hypothetical protein